MDTNGLSRMLGRGFGNLIKNVDANKLSLQIENLKKAFQKGYNETVNGTNKTESSSSTKATAEHSEPASHAAAERPSEPTKP